MMGYINLKPRQLVGMRDKKLVAYTWLGILEWQAFLWPSTLTSYLFPFIS